MTTTPLEIDALSTGYRLRGGTRRVGHDLSARLEEGTLTALIGVNGCGKSTLLRTLAGFLRPLSGDIRYGGTDIADLTPRQMARRLSIVLTEKPDTAFLSVRDVVETGRYAFTGLTGRLSGADRDIVDKALQQTGTFSLATRRLASLSDGERQRVMIAKAVAQQAPLILLDEPTAFLDFPGKADILRLLAHLAHEERKTILLATHDLELTFRVADALWLLSPDGIHSGSPHQLAADGTLAARFAGRGLSFNAESLAFTLA